MLKCGSQKMFLPRSHFSCFVFNTFEARKTIIISLSETSLNIYTARINFIPQKNYVIVKMSKIVISEPRIFIKNKNSLKLKIKMHS